MSSDDQSSDIDDEPDELTDQTNLLQASSTYKVRGAFEDDTGAGVLGKNTSGSGTPIGVEGAVPNASGGYGLSTPHDANVSGIAEVGGISGSVTGNTEITNLLGESLRIDGSNTLQVQSAFRTNSFGSAGTDWNPFSGLPSGTPVQVTYDTNGLNTGRLIVEVDGTKQTTETLSNQRTRIFGGSSVTIKSRKDFGYDTRFYVGGEDTDALGLTFKGDGTRMYLSGNSNDSIFQYDLSTAWDLGSASYDNTSLDVSGQDAKPRGLAFKDDGTRMFLAGQNSTYVFQYDLSNAWEIGSASLNDSFNPAPFDLSDVEFKSDGSKMYVSDPSNDTITTYDLNTAWDVTSTSSENRTQFDFTGTNDPSEISGIGFTDDGSRLFLTQVFGGGIYVYDLSTPWDLSSRSYVWTSEITTETDATQNIAVKGDGTQAYISDPNNSDVNQYNETFDGTAYATVEKERP